VSSWVKAWPGARDQWPQLAHEPALQLEHAAAEVVCFSTPDMPKVEGSFSTSSEPQLGQRTAAEARNWSFSNRPSQPVQRYSKTGTGPPPQDNIAQLSVLDSRVVPIPESLVAVLTAPKAADLWRLRGELLEAGVDGGPRVSQLLERFHSFLDAIETTASSRDFSELASKLDIGAISGVILEHLAERGEASDRALRLMSGVVSEGLMALATRQHVRAWSNELSAHYRTAAWYLYEELWYWTTELKPELEAEERRQLLDALMAPISSPEPSGIQKAVLVGRLFQMLLLGRLADVLPEPDLARIADLGLASDPGQPPSP
jgi:hypothetical protein